MAQFATVLGAEDAERFNELAWSLVATLPDGCEPIIQLESLPNSNGALRILETDDEDFLVRFRNRWEAMTNMRKPAVRCKIWAFTRIGKSMGVGQF